MANDIFLVFQSDEANNPTAIAQRVAKMAEGADFWYGLENAFAFRSKLTSVEISEELSKDFENFLIAEIDSASLTGSLPGYEWFRLNAEVFRHSFPRLLSNIGAPELNDHQVEELIDRRRAEIEKEKRMVREGKEDL